MRVESIQGSCLQLFVNHFAGMHWTDSLVASRMLAIQFLWESLSARSYGDRSTFEQAQEYREAAPLWNAMWEDTLKAPDADFNSRAPWQHAHVPRFISCVGVVDRENCDAFWLNLKDPKWNDPDRDRSKTPQGTMFIAVTDPEFITHLAPAMWWESLGGNGKERITLVPEWRTSTVMQLARGIYDNRNFDDLPILADALQDADCDCDDILNHFRDPNATHVRGCWALDLVLGKQ